MQFTDDNIRYLLLSWDKPTNDHIDSYINQDLTISGLYLWHKALNGSIGFPQFPDQFAEYNLIHVNITPRNIPLIPKIIPLIDRSKTKLLFNVDHAVSMWSSVFNYPHLMLHILDMADYIFAVEPTMAGMLSDALKRNVPTIPHPVDVENISAFRTHERETRIGVSIHRYDRNTILPWFALKDLPPHWATSAIGSQAPSDPIPNIQHLFNEIQPHLDFATLMKFTSSLYAVLESYTIPSYGRYTAECAALGVPVVGSDIVASQCRCFPFTALPRPTPSAVRSVINKLIEDSDFYTEVTKKAIERSEYYSIASSRKRMLDFLNH